MKLLEKIQYSIFNLFFYFIGHNGRLACAYSIYRFTKKVEKKGLLKISDFNI